MCGICGVYNYGTQEPADPHLLRQMTAALVHRGPDDDGFAMDGSLGLGMRRLSIIDLDGGAQPMHNEARTLTLVFNGEIYNFPALTQDLTARGHRFATRSDTETIVHAYEEWGLGALARLNGMYGLALWDAREKTLILARDPFGIKPLYFWNDGRRLIFGSEIRSILCHPHINRSVDLEGLASFIRYTYVPSPRTAFAGIQKLLPGHALLCSPSGVEIRGFYDVSPRLPAGESEAELVEELADAIDAAVLRQMVADVPVGVMLSGGLDSTTVATIMAGAREREVDTFTVGFGRDFGDDELDQARAVADRLGTRHHEITISSQEYLDFLPAAVWHLEEPIATASTPAFHRVCELARRHVKVVLTGQGADEPFGGYARYLGERYGSIYRGIPGPLRERVVMPLVRRLPRNEQLKRAASSVGIADGLARLQSVYSVADDRLCRALLGPLADVERRGDFAQWFEAADGRGPMNRMMYVDARSSLADNLLLYGDKMSMAVSLEARVPFLDLELMRLAEGIPERLKIKGLTRKYILKEAMRRWLPSEMLAMRKIGFKTPVDEWFRSDLRSVLEERLLAAGSASRSYFDADVVRRVMREHESGRHDHKRLLFSLLTFELWHEQFIAPLQLTPPARSERAARPSPRAN